MKLSLHIGTEKSGTTSIQSFLKVNTPLLRSNDILVPGSLGRSTHRKLPSIFMNNGMVDDFFQGRGMLEPNNRLAAKHRWRQAFEAEMQSWQGGHVVISSEHLQSRLKTPDEVRALSNCLAPLFDEIDVILYLRDPLDTAVSLFSTAVKAGSKQPDIPDPDHPYWNNIVHHQNTILRWRENFACTRLAPRLFEKDSFVGKDLLHDFIAAAQLPRLSYEFPPRANETLDLIGIELLRRFNWRIPVFLPSGATNPTYRRLLRHIETHFTGGRRFLPRQETVSRYTEAFSESNEWVRKTFFPDRSTLFTPKQYETALETPLSSGELDDLAAFVMDIVEPAPQPR